MTDEEARRIVVVKLPAYVKYEGHHVRIAWSDGTGRLHVFPEDLVVEDAAARYLEAMGTPRCCTVEEPCDRHRGALRGRDWKTGEYL